MAKTKQSRAVELDFDGKKRIFDIDDPVLPDWIGQASLAADGYPYKKKMDKSEYSDTLERLQIELVKLQGWLQATGKRTMVLFEGRDAAGKGGAILAISACLNPRSAHVVALSKPTEKEQGQWYYQRYISNFPAGGEIVLFDRSWYNRAGVEPVMGFCTPEEHRKFLKETPRFEKLIVNDGMHFFKIWLDIGRETQLERFHDRRHDPLKTWKLSPMDIAALPKWDEYTRNRDAMLEATHTDWAPWTVVEANDKRRTRLNIIRHILISHDYEGKDKDAIGQVDDKILGFGPKFLK